MIKSIKTRLIISFIIGVLLIVILGITSVVNFIEWSDLSGWVDHTHKVLYKLEITLSTLRDAENAQRGFIITNKTRYLEPYDTAIETINPLLKEIRQLTSDNPQQQKRLDELQMAVDTRLGDIEETVYLRMNVGHKQALDVMRTGYGKKHMDNIREIIATMISAEKALIDIRIKKENSKAFMSIVLIWMLVILSSLIVVVLCFTITRSITSGIKFLQDSMDKLSTGNINVLIKEKRDDEIGSLYLGFNHAISNLNEVNEELIRLTRMDELTGITNRDFFYEIVDMEYRRAARDKKILSIIICDIDFFRHYNDTYGHVFGDECLKKIADTIHRTFQRAGEVSARLGGEEFAIILPATEAQDVAILAEMLRQAIWLLKIPHQNSKVADRVTVSVGSASIEADKDQDFEVLIQTADKALEQAKKKGRNCVVQAK